MRFDFDIAEDEALTFERALQPAPDQVADAAVRPIGADQPRCFDLLGPAIGALKREVNRIVILAQSRQREAAVDGHSECGQVPGQHALSLGLGSD
jgi:hypothetical protein